MHILIWVDEMSHLEALALPVVPLSPGLLCKAVSELLVKGHFGIKAVVYPKHWCRATGRAGCPAKSVHLLVVGWGEAFWTLVVWEFS